MSNILTRIDRLETTTGGAGRVIAIRSNGASAAEVDQFVAQLDLRFDRRHDSILHLALIDGKPVDCELMSAMPCRK